MSNDATKKSHKKLLTLLLFFVFVFPVLVFYSSFHQKQSQNKEVQIDGLYLKTPADISDFKLTDNRGNVFTKENFKGRWTLLFFGFTNCGNVCPTTMSSLNKMYRKLQDKLPDNQLPQIVLVSVDPERDSIKRLNEYVNAFNPKFIGVRGDMQKTLALEKQFHIAAAKMQVAGKDKTRYTIDHTADILLVNPDAKLQAFFSYPHEADKMVRDYRASIQS